MAPARTFKITNSISNQVYTGILILLIKLAQETQLMMFSKNVCTKEGFRGRTLQSNASPGTWFKGMSYDTMSWRLQC